MSNIAITSSPEMELQNTLEPGETLLWSDKPNPVVVARGSTFQACLGGFIFAFIVIFGLNWFGMQSKGAPTPLSFNIIPVIVFTLFAFNGLRMLISPLFDYRNAAKTIYGLTHQRLVAVNADGNATVHSYYPKDIVEIERIERPDGTGNIKLLGRQIATRRGQVNSSITLYGISDVSRIDRLIRSTLVTHQPVSSVT